MSLGRLGQRIAAALGRSASAGAPPSTMPEGILAYAIGDVHGRSDLLRRLLGSMMQDARPHIEAGARPLVVFLGDYVDRGTDSRGVFDCLLDEMPSGWDCRFLKGNHEEALLAFLRDPQFGDVWREYGGLQTLVSYGVQLHRNGGKIDWDRAAEEFAIALPRRHLDFVSSLSLFEVVGDYVFVHAGVRPRIPLQYQSEKDLLWIREEFTAAGRALPQTVVYGHTPGEEVAIGDGRIGLDTGAYLTGKLTAAGFKGEDVWFLST